jgi:hypothetical protein
MTSSVRARIDCGTVNCEALMVLDDDLDQRVERLERLLVEIARERNWWLSGDLRIGEADCAALLGWTVESLRNARCEGRAPPSYSIGGARHRRTYRLHDVAVWVEVRRQD